MPENDKEFNAAAYEAYKVQKKIFKPDFPIYEQQEKVFGDIISFI